MRAPFKINHLSGNVISKTRNNVATECIHLVCLQQRTVILRIYSTMLVMQHFNTTTTRETDRYRKLSNR